MPVQQFYPQIFIKVQEISFSLFHGFLEIYKIGKTGESTNTYFPVFLSISLDRIISLTFSIPHLKGLGMRNLQYEKRTSQKIVKFLRNFMNQNLCLKQKAKADF